MSFYKILLRSAVLALSILASDAAYATSLVNGFNVVTLGNFTSQNSDLQGTLAVGQNLSLTNYALNQSAPHPNTSAGGFDTVVGGALSLNSGTIYGKVSASSAQITNASVCFGCLSTGTSPINFASLASQVKAENTFLYTLSPTGSVAMPYSTLELSASGSSPLQIFTVTSSQLSGNSGININGLASNATVIINVSDSGSHAASTSSAGLSINGSQSQSATNILFNFADSISTISIQNSFYASLLAPSASVAGTYGAFNGDLVAASYRGNNQFNLNSFSGSLPSSAPEPGTFGLLTGVAFASAAYVRRGSIRRFQFKRGGSAV